jgi:hypothetical protein
MNRAEHYIEAERLLEKANWPDNHPEGSKFYAMLGIIHALLAGVSSEVASKVEVQANRDSGSPAEARMSGWTASRVVDE